MSMPETRARRPRSAVLAACLVAVCLVPAGSRADPAEDGLRDTPRVSKRSGLDGIWRFRAGIGAAIPVNQFDSEAMFGTLIDLDIEYQSFAGLWIGFEISPAGISLPAGPNASARLKIGYSRETFALGLSLGAYWYLHYPLPEVGPILRLGKLTGTHAYLRLNWSITPYPSSGQLTVNINLSDSWNLHLDVIGDLAMFGLDSCLGAQYVIPGDDGKRVHLITFGAGVGAYPIGNPGPSVKLGYEMRW